MMANFLQTTPISFDLEKFEREVVVIPKVRSTHHTHGWSLDGERHVLSTHLVRERDSTRDQIVAAKWGIRAMLDEREFVHVTIDVELEGEECAALDARSD